MNTSEYVVRLRAEISSFKKNMETARQSMKQVEGSGEKLKKGFSSHFSNATKSTEKFKASFTRTASSVKTAAGGIGTALKALGGIVIAAFSVKAIVGFGKEAINAAAKLNAMTAMSNKAFGSMAGDVQAWAKTASTSYGLSQRMALQYTSTLGSMAQGFGISQAAAVQLSESIAGRIGDLASYYSITQDEAYSKMTAIFTGETEALKSLGIVMTQTALDSFALANGFGKTTSQMTEQEKVMLRYKFIMEQTKLAENDFTESTARGSWGNQIRRLKLQIEDFKASVGQGLIVVLTPVMSLLNQLMGKLVAVGNAFSDLMAKISGKTQKSVSSVVPAVSNLGAAATESVSEAEDAAKSATNEAKKASKSVLSFDQLHTLAAEDKDEKDTSKTEAGTAAPVDNIKTEMQNVEDATKNTTGIFDKIIKKAKELKNIFAAGFKIGFGDTNFNPLLENITRIGDAFKKIFLSDEVVKSASQFVNKIVYALGQNVGAVVSMATSIATGITGSIATYLEQNTPQIKNFLVSMFDIGGSLAELQGNFVTALATIFSVLTGDNAIQAGANFIGIFVNAFMGVTELIGKFVLDLSTLLLQPIIDNAEGIKSVLDGLLGVVASVLGTIKDTIDATVEKALQVYDEHIHPFFESLTQGISEIIAHCTEAWQTYIKPVLDFLAEKVDTVFKEHIQPMINSALELVGQIADMLKAFWENILKPLILWIIDTLTPIVAPIIQFIGTVFLDVVAGISDGVKLVIDIFKGIVKFLTDVFKGDWSAAWEDIKAIGSTIWNGIKNLIGGFINKIKEHVTTVWNAIKNTTVKVFTAIRERAGKIWNKIKTVIGTPIKAAKDKVVEIVGIIRSKVVSVFGKIRDRAKEIWDKIKGFIGDPIKSARKTVKDAVEGIKTKVTATFNTVKERVENVWNKIKGFIGDPIKSARTTVKNTVDGIKTKVTTTFNTVKTNVENVWKKIKGFITNPITNAKNTVSSIVTTIKTKITNTFTNVKNSVESIFDSIKGFITSPIETAQTIVENAVNGIKDILNFFGLDIDIETQLSGVQNALTAPFTAAQGIIDGAVSGIKKVASGIGGFFNGVGDFVFGGNNNTINLTGYATGGFPEDGLFMANHNELVGSFKGKSAVVNNTQIIQGVSDGVADAIAPFMMEILTAMAKEKSGGTPIIEIDGERMARVVMRNWNNIQNREYAVVR